MERFFWRLKQNRFIREKHSSFSTGLAHNVSRRPEEPQNTPPTPSNSPLLPALRIFTLQSHSPISARNWASRSTRFTDGGRELRETCSLTIWLLHFGDMPSPFWVRNPSGREGLRQQQSGKLARLLPKTRRSGALVPGILVRGGQCHAPGNLRCPTQPIRVQSAVPISRPSLKNPESQG
jgi:hypothetical protein